MSFMYEGKEIEIKSFSNKRKNNCSNNYHEYIVTKRTRIKDSKQKRKLDIVYDNNINQKKQKVIHCLIHNEKYICDMYECRGIKEKQIKCNNISYII